MAIADDIRKAVQQAKAATAIPSDNPFKKVLDEVAKGLTDEQVEAWFTPGPGGRWTLRLAPAYRPGRAAPIVGVLIRPQGADVLLNPTRSAANPDELAKILKDLVTTPEFIESLQITADLTREPVEGFLRIRPESVSREDLMLEVSPENQCKIAQACGHEISLCLPIAKWPGAGKFHKDAEYRVLESAGYSVILTKKVVAEEVGLLEIVGNVEQTAEV